MISMAKKNKTFTIVAIISIVNALGYGIIIPLIYPFSQKFGLTDFQNGMLFSLFSICSFIATPIIGRLSDKYGRKPLLFISVCGTAISFLLQASAVHAWVLFLARALDGITAGNWSVISAVISDITEPKDRAKGYGIIGASFGFGFVFGPAIAAFTSNGNIRTPFYIAGIISAVAAIITLIFLEETNKTKGILKKEKLFDLHKLIKSLQDPDIGRVLSISLIYSLAWSLFTFAFQPFALHILKVNTKQIAETFTGIGIVGLIAQGYLMPRTAAKIGQKRAFQVALGITAICFLQLFFVKHFIYLMIVILVLAFANSYVSPLIQTFLSEKTDPAIQGEVQGLNSSYTSLGNIVGPIVGGFIAGHSIPATFLVPTVLSVLCFYIFYKFRLEESKLRTN